MEELLLGLLYVFAEALFEVFLELAGEAVISFLSRATGGLFAKFPTLSSTLAVFVYFLVGGAAGALSVVLIPHRILHPSRFHGLSILLSPLLTGFAMWQAGLSMRRRGQEPARIESFTYGFTFALGMAIVRFVFVK
jgi:hypothetical protein